MTGLAGTRVLDAAWRRGCGTYQPQPLTEQPLRPCPRAQARSVGTRAVPRRTFLALMIGAAARPLPAHAQRPAMPVIGFLGSASPVAAAHFLRAFREGLGTGGYVEGRNLAIEYRWAENRYDRLPALAEDLVRQRVAVIIASGGPVPALAAKAATSTIPIVFTATSDPVKLGLVASVNRPGGNITGSGMLTIELEPKRMEFLRELVPGARTVGALVNPNRTDVAAQIRAVQDAARMLGLEVTLLRAGNERDLDPAFAALAQQREAALVVGADPFFNDRRAQVVALAARHAIPTIYMMRDFVAAGGLASYGASIAAGYRQAGVYAGRILNGARPADLPVVQPTTFELAINLRTAKALGLTVSPTLLARADEVIE
jgi:putative ABC transport system substrate-binding protein